jgi:hypothetical protein
VATAATASAAAITGGRSLENLSIVIPPSAGRYQFAPGIMPPQTAARARMA